MALINCPKCGKQISDRSLQCPQCGLTKEEREKIMSNEFDNSTPVSNNPSSEQQQKLLEELKKELEKKNATLKAIDDAIAKHNEKLKKNEVFFNEQEAKKRRKVLGWSMLGLIVVLIIIACILLFVEKSKNETTVGQRVGCTFEKTDYNIPKEDLVDLGLSSGTLWRKTNESEHYTFDEAVSIFGNALPTGVQLDELKKECKWTWVSTPRFKGYQIVGPNGNSIELPAEGHMEEDGNWTSEGDCGCYISSSMCGSDGVWRLGFYQDASVGTYCDSRYNNSYDFKFSIRLVQKE